MAELSQNSSFCPQFAAIQRCAKSSSSWFIYSSRRPVCKAGWRPFCHCRIRHDQAPTLDPESLTATVTDPLYRFHQWQANLRVLEVTEIYFLDIAQ
jgi:hypothetical protein